ncbi:MAG: hypothetical protein IKS45_00870, partial [Thermoguttaceae bacterium]|nr:hypothetical protein [Thermoguttaceae bacterium]
MENDNLNIEELLVLYAIGSLEPEEVSAVEDELKKHPELMAQVEKYRRTDSLLSAVFAQSDAAVQQTIAEESAKPKFAGKTETSQSSLARRFAFSVAALALILVVGVLLYPQFGRNDVQVALTNQDDNNNSASENVKMEDANSSVGQAPDQHIVMSEENPQIASGVNIFEKSLPDDLEDDANTGMAEDLNPAPMIAQDTIEAENAPDAESPEAQFSMRNALYNVPGQKTDDGMAPMRLVQNSRVKGIDESAPAPGSYVVLQKSV